MINGYQTLTRSPAPTFTRTQFELCQVCVSCLYKYMNGALEFMEHFIKCLALSDVVLSHAAI